MTSPTHHRTFRLPDLGEGLESAEITGWEVADGEVVELNQVLCRVETAKAEVEVPSPFVGRVIERHGNVGDEIPVGAALVTVEVDGAGPDGGDGDERPERARPVLVGYGDSPGSAGGRRARVTRQRPGTRRRTRSGGSVARLGPIGPGTEVPMRGVRATTAERMAASRREIPDATAGTWVDATALLERREQLQADLAASGDTTRLTPFAVICHLIVRALRAHPELNATLDDDGERMWLLDDVHLGFATAAPHGLVVPVVHHASDATLGHLAAEVARLATAARDRTIAPSELVGSTFTVSNFGAFGIDDGIPIVNPHEAAIVGVGAITNRPRVHHDQIAIRSVLKVTCAFDHRLCDGAQAAGFVRTLADLIEAADVNLDDTP